MRRCAQLPLLLAVALTLGPAAAAPDGRGYPPEIPNARIETYKEANGTTLDLWILTPETGPAEGRPAIVFFFGGGWRAGSPQQFEMQCRHLAARGMVAIMADYRVASRHDAKPVECLADARSAIRWVRANAERLGIDPDRIAAGGGSAGGHLAGSTPFIAEFDEPGEDATVSAVPDALVLFNPALVLAPLPGFTPDGFGVRVPAERLGCEPERLSPAHHVKPAGPPTIILHGRADTTVPIETAEVFTERMRQAGNRCELIGYDEQPHGFFNREPWQSRTLAEADAFLVSLGWIDPPADD
jgi:acetyl esterase